MTDDFDDQALRDAIGARSGGAVHSGDARQAIVARATRTRTLRTAAIGGTATFVVIVGLVLLPNIGDTPGSPADQPAAPVPTSGTTGLPPATTVRPSDNTSMMPAPTTPTPATTFVVTTTPGETATAGPATTAPSGVAPTTLSTTPAPQPTLAPTTAPTPTSPPATTPSTTTTSPTIPTTSTTPDPTEPPFTRQYDSPGGSITVNWDGSALTLVSTAASDGYETEIEDQTSTRIRVRFRGEDDDHRIEVRAEDGQVEHSVS